MVGMVADINARIAAEAIRVMPFDSSPYAYRAWLAAVDKR
jgi:negative regulator of sigma E activity